MFSNSNNTVVCLAQQGNSSLYQWIPRNVKSMNRRNKMSSEIFKVVVPSEENEGVETSYDFRIVLLRGVVRAESELDDPLAAFVEYVPDSNNAATDNNSAEQQQHPEGCKVGVWCVHNDRVPAATSGGSMFSAGELRDEEEGGGGGDVVPSQTDLPRGKPHLYEEETFVFNPTTKMLGFKELIPASAVNNDGFVDPSALNAMIIRVEITTGVSSVADVVARTTDRWSSSLWGSATSVFAAVQASIEVVSSNVKGWLDTVDDRTEQVDEVDSHRTLPWEEVPAKWTKSGKTLEDWAALLTQQLPEDEGTFLFGAERGINPDEQVLMTQLGLQHKTIINAAHIFDYNRDIHEGLLGALSIRQQRYHLVPGRVSEERFWANYMWKVAALATCNTQEQIQLLLSILNAPPTPSPRRGSQDGSSLARTTNASRGGVLGDKRSGSSARGGDQDGDDNEAMLGSAVGAAVKEALEAKDVLTELLEGYMDTRGVDAESDEVLINSAKKSCEKQKERVVAMMERAAAAAKKRKESVSDCGLCAGLHSTLRTLDDAIESVSTTIALVKSGGGGNNDESDSGSASYNSDSEQEAASPGAVEGPVAEEKGAAVDEEEAVAESNIDDNEGQNNNQVSEEKEEEVTPSVANVPVNVVQEAIPVAVDEVAPMDNGGDAVVAETTPLPAEEVCEVEATADTTPTADQEEEVKTDIIQKDAVTNDESDFDELPDIDQLSPTVPPTTTNTKTPPKSSTSVSSPTESGRKIEFEPMPWDDDEE